MRWRAAVSTLFFLSGSTGLIFEVLWTRLISSLVGGTAIAMTCVFMVFIVALSFGARLAGRVEATGREALMRYGLVEIAVGLLGFALTMLMLYGRDSLIATLGGIIGLQGVWSWVLISAVLIGPPATLMGLTLPLALNALSGFTSPREHVTTIYGINILGGATGALLTGFLLIWKLGITGTALLAMGLNIAIGAVSLAVWWATRRVTTTREAPSAAVDATASQAPGASMEASTKWLFFSIALFGGLASLGYELLWGRLAKFILGDRTMATATLLAIYLTCMALGSFEVKRLAEKFGWKTPERLFTTSALILLIAALAHPLMWWVTQAILTSGFADVLFAQGNTLVRMVLMMLLILAPAAILGVSFPLLMYGAQELDELPSAVVGRLYFVNSIGAAIGSLAGGYYLPRLVGTANSFFIFTGILVVMAVVCLAAAKPAASRLVPHAVCGAAIILCVALAPRQLLFFDTEHETLVDTAEDEYGIQVTTRDDEGMLKVKNNRVYIAYKLGRAITNLAQEYIAYASCMLAPSCSEVLNIGTGYGITAGAYTLMKDVDTIVTVEMLPYVFEHQRMYEPYNHEYLDDDRVERVLGDGRQYLTRSERTWDIISVNVMDPYMPGSSELFTTEFWELAASKLDDDGVYCQLFFGSDVDLLYKGISQVFDSVLLFEAYKGSYNVVAFKNRPEDLHMRLERMTPEARDAFHAVTKRKRVEAYWPAALVEAQARSKAFDEKVAGLPERVHSDNWPVLEYRWSQGMGGVLSMFDSMQAYDYE